MESWIVEGTPSRRFPVYSRANTGEVLPEPASPLGWTLTWLPGVVEGWADGHVWLGTYERREFTSPPEVVDCFGGYLYINVSVARVYGERTPGASAQLIDDVFFGDHPDVPAYHPHPEDHSEAALERMTRTLEWVLGSDDLPELRADRDEADAVRGARPDLAAIDDAALVAHARSLVPLVRRLFERHFIVSAMAAVGPGVVTQVVTDAVGDPTLTLRLLAGIGEVDSAAPSWAMWELSRVARGAEDVAAALDAGVAGALARIGALTSDAARSFREGFAALLERYGSRGPNEWDIRSHTWETDPSLALALVDRMRHVPDGDSPFARHDERVKDREQVLARVLDAIGDDVDTATTLQRGIRSGQLFLAGRERTKTNIIKVLHEIRLAVQELGRRMVARGVLGDVQQITMLTDGELDAYLADPASFRTLIEERNAQYLALYDLEPPFVVDSVPLPLSSWQRRGARAVTPVSVGERLQGGAGCPGRHTGRARIVMHPSEVDELEPDDVLIAPVTDPAWTPLFVTAGAAIVDVGAMASHAIIVSRELGIPCVVSVKDATRRIPDGAIVTVDGDAGTVEVVALPA